MSLYSQLMEVLQSHHVGLWHSFKVEAHQYVSNYHQQMKW